MARIEVAGCCCARPLPQHEGGWGWQCLKCGHEIAEAVIRRLKRGGR